MSRLSNAGKPQRRPSTLINNFTGLKPLSTAQREERPETDEKVVKLAKRLEDLVLLAQNNQRDEAREGVRMAEDSAEAIEEGQSTSGPEEERDYYLERKKIKSIKMISGIDEVGILLSAFVFALNFIN